MITESKVTDFFVLPMIFARNLRRKWQKTIPSSTSTPRRRRNRMMSDAEVITILICFHFNTYRNFKQVFKGIAEKGKSTMGWYVGFKLPLLCNEKGELINFVLTKVNVDDRNESVIDTLTDEVFRHRSVHDFLMNMLAAIGAYCFFATKPEVNFDFEVPESNGQLVLWQ